MQGCSTYIYIIYICGDEYEYICVSHVPQTHSNMSHEYNFIKSWAAQEQKRLSPCHYIHRVDKIVAPVFASLSVAAEVVGCVLLLHTSLQVSLTLCATLSLSTSPIYVRVLSSSICLTRLQ